MTPRWEHYNKPSTTTSVDSCHKMPLEEQQPGLFESKSIMSSSTAGVEPINDRSQLHAGSFDKTNVTSSSSVACHTEPCNSSVARSDIGSGSAVACSNCGVTATPLWRRAPTGEIICNACGLYLKARNATRPTWLKRNTFARKNVNASKLQHRFVLQEQTKSYKDKPEQEDPIIPTTPSDHNSPEPETPNGDRPQMVCANCSTTTTPLWRRDEEGNTICNACGLYYKLHNVQRPVTMKRSVIKRRKRVHANIISQHHHPLPQPIQQRRLCPKHHHHHHSSDDHPPMLTHDSSSSGGEVSTDDDESNDRKRRYYEDGFRSVKRMNYGYEDRQYHSKNPQVMEPTSIHAPLPSQIASLLNPVQEQASHPLVDRKSQSTATAAAIATVSALLNPHSDVQHTQKVLEAHRQELRREVQHLTSLLSKTHAVLDNLDNAMVHAGVEPVSSPTQRSATPGFSPSTAVSILGNLLGGGDPNATNALATILTLGAAAAAASQKDNVHLAPLKASPTPPSHRELPPTPPPCPILPYPMDRRQSASSDSR